MKEQEAISSIMKILRYRSPNIIEYLENLTELNKIPKNIREDIVNELSNEFCEKGLKENSEPNDYGLMIEDLIDKCHICGDKAVTD